MKPCYCTRTFSRKSKGIKRSFVGSDDKESPIFTRTKIFVKTRIVTYENFQCHPYSVIQSQNVTKVASLSVITQEDKEPLPAFSLGSMFYLSSSSKACFQLNVLYIPTESCCSSECEQKEIFFQTAIKLKYGVGLEKKPKLCKSLSQENKLNGFLVGIVDLLWRELKHEKPPKSSASLRFVTFLSHCCIWSSSHCCIWSSCFYNAHFREKALLGKCLKIQICKLASSENRQFGFFLLFLNSIYCRGLWGWGWGCVHRSAYCNMVVVGWYVERIGVCGR